MDRFELVANYCKLKNVIKGLNGDMPTVSVRTGINTKNCVITVDNIKIESAYHIINGGSLIYLYSIYQKELLIQMLNKLLDEYKECLGD